MWNNIYIFLLPFLLNNNASPEASSTNTEIFHTGEVENVAIDKKDSCSLTAKWDVKTSTGIEKYKISWKSTKDPSHKNSSTAGMKDTAFQIKELRPNTEYEITVQPLPSGKKTAPLKAISDKPPKVKNLKKGDITNSRIYTTWEKPDGDCKIESYSVKWSGVVNWDKNRTDSGSYTTKDTSYVLTNLVPDATYQVQVYARANNEESDPAELKDVVTKERSPSEPVDFKAVSMENAIVSLSWKDPLEKNGKILQYQIWWKKLNDSEAPVIMNVTDTETKGHNVTNLVGCTEYQFYIRAVNKIGNGTKSNDSASTLPAPVSVAKLSVAAYTNESLTVNWDAPVTNCNVTGFTIRGVGHKLSDDNSTHELNAVKVSGTKFTYNLTKLWSYTEYEISVTAEVESKIEGKAFKAKNATLQGVPSAPNNLVVIERQTTKNSLTIEWTKPNIFNGKIEHFLISWGGAEDTKGIQIYTDKPKYSFIITGLYSNKIYYITVQAKTGGGLGAFAKTTGQTKVNTLGIVLGVLIPLLVIGVALVLAFIFRHRINCPVGPFNRT